MNSTYSIYTHTSPSGKVYVGQTINIKKRWEYNGEHYKNKKKDGSYVQAAFARAIDKYGWKNFKHEVLLEGIIKGRLIMLRSISELQYIFTIISDILRGTVLSQLIYIFAEK